METLILPVYIENPHPRHIRTAADALERGGIALIPTETGYCLVGDARLDSTHRTFLALRQAHPNKKPFSLLCRDLAQVSRCALLPTSVFRVATRAFPGPYTFILEASRSTPKPASGRRKTTGVRISSHPVARALCEAFREPLLITSVTDAQELTEDQYFDDRDREADAWWTTAAGVCSHFPRGIEVALECREPVPMRVSTIIDFSVVPPVLIRDGGWGNEIIGLVAD